MGGLLGDYNQKLLESSAEGVVHKSELNSKSLDVLDAIRRRRGGGRSEEVGVGVGELHGPV